MERLLQLGLMPRSSSCSPTPTNHSDKITQSVAKLVSLRHTETIIHIYLAVAELAVPRLVYIIAPYNFPFYLTFGPLVASISAGNCVWPSALKSRFQDLNISWICCRLKRVPWCTIMIHHVY